MLAGLLLLALPACGGGKKTRALQIARAELLAEQWRREAVYGVKDEPRRIPHVRRVFVPERVQNGVRIRGGVQEVWVLP